MADTPSVSLYPRARPVSTLPQAILIWPNGVTGPVEFFPLGCSQEENVRIRAILEQAFASLQAGRAGIDDERPTA